MFQEQRVVEGGRLRGQARMLSSHGQPEVEDPQEADLKDIFKGGLGLQLRGWRRECVCVPFLPLLPVAETGSGTLAPIMS